MNPPSGSQLTVFLAGKLFFLIYRVVIPCLVLPVWKVVRYYSTNQRGSRLKREFRAHTNRMTSRALRSRVPKISLPRSPTPSVKRLSPGLFSAVESFGSAEGSVLSQIRYTRICRYVLHQTVVRFLNSFGFSLGLKQANSQCSMKPGFGIDYVFILPLLSVYIFIIIVIIMMSPLSVAD